MVLLKITLKSYHCYSGMHKTVNLQHFLSDLNTVSNLKPFINYIESPIITLKI